MSIAVIRVWDSVILSAIISVCPHEKTKLGTAIVHHDTSPTDEYFRPNGHRVKKMQKGDRVAGVSYALYRVPSRYVLLLHYN